LAQEKEQPSMAQQATDGALVLLLMLNVVSVRSRRVLLCMLGC
jgi:hypothetical protein